MEVEAGASLAELLREPAGAGGQQEGAVHLVDRLVDDEGGDVRPDIGRAVVLPLEDVPDARVGLLRDLDVAVALVVLEQDVIFGGMQLDHAALEHERLEFAVGDDIVEVVDVAHHLVDLGQMLFHRAEIAAHAVFERLGLADIDDVARAVLHDVHARPQRQLVRLFGEVWQTRVIQGSPPSRNRNCLPIK